MAPLSITTSRERVLPYGRCKPKESENNAEYNSYRLAEHPTQKEVKNTVRQDNLPHLNGLRALAFLGVFFFHFKHGCQGGFLGVDIFFVLSGFLMTRSIFLQVSRGSFAYTDFLYRRFWRLYPALLSTILPTLLLSYGLFPSEFALQVVYSSSAAVLGVSNHLFLSQEGYFGTSSVMKPLLHTWSLSVEWQFYLLWPGVVSGCRRLPGVVWTRLVLAATCSISFVYAVRVAHYAPKEAFFLLPGRVFEFGIGALASTWSTNKATGFAWNILSTTGTLLILAAFQFVNSTHAAPAIVALPAVAGAVLIIMSPSDLVANSIYMSPLFEYIGRISYSAYLVHWPVYVFYNYIHEHESPSIWAEVCVMTMLMLFSALMFHSVENEFRIPRRMRHHCVGLLLGLSCFAMFISGSTSDGWRSRLPSRAGLSRATSSQRQMRMEFEALYTPHEQPLGGGRGIATYGSLPGWTVKTVESGTYFDAVFVGDSFAGPLAGVLEDIALEQNKTFLLMSHFSCAPLFDRRSLNVELRDYPNAANNPRGHACKAEVRPEMLRFIKAANTTVVGLLGNWGGLPEMYEEQKGFAKQSELDCCNETVGIAKLHETVRVLLDLGKKVVLIGVVPGSPYDVRACYAAAGPLSFLKRCPTEIRAQAAALRERSLARDMLTKLVTASPVLSAQVRERNVAYIDPWIEICDFQSGLCRVGSETEPFYYDKTHLTKNGSLLLRQSLVRSFAKLMP